MNESGVNTLNMSHSTALAPEPESGLNNIKGSSSLLKCITLQAGESIFTINSLSPLSRKTLTLTVNAKRNGNMFKVVFIPFLAPVTNVA